MVHNDMLEETTSLVTEFETRVFPLICHPPVHAGGADRIFSLRCPGLHLCCAV